MRQDDCQLAQGSSKLPQARKRSSGGMGRKENKWSCRAGPGACPSESQEPDQVSDVEF